MPGLGTIVNTVAIIAGGLVGLLFKKGIPKRFQEIVFTAMGTGTFLIGLLGVVTQSVTASKDGVLSSSYALGLVLSLVLGGLLGEAIGIDRMFNRVGNFLKRKLSKPGASEENGDIGAGFACATVLFCSGAMAIIGSIQDGIMGDPSMLFTKALLDGVISIIVATVYGYGVMLSAASVFIYQGAITLLAVLAGDLLPMTVIGQMSLVGSAVLMLIGFDLWGLKKFNVANLIPAAFIPILLYPFLS